MTFWEWVEMTIWCSVLAAFIWFILEAADIWAYWGMR